MAAARSRNPVCAPAKRLDHNAKAAFTSPGFVARPQQQANRLPEIASNSDPSWITSFAAWVKDPSRASRVLGFTYWNSNDAAFRMQHSITAKISPTALLRHLNKI